MINFIISFLSLFFLVYTIPLKVIPFGLGTRMILSVLGLVVFVFNILKFKKKGIFKIDLNLILSFLILFLLLLISVITILVNQSNDYSFLRTIFAIILNIFASYFVYTRFLKIKNFNVNQFVLIISLIPNLYLLLSLFVQISSEFRTIVINFLDPKDFIVFQLFNYSFSSKISGIGANPYVVGVFNAFTLVVLFVYLSLFKLKKRVKFYYFISIFFILIIGNMIARTTSIGLIIGFIYYLIYNFINLKIKISSLFNNIFSILIFTFFISMLPFFISDEIKLKLYNSFNYAFELVINIIDGNGIRTASTEELKDMYVFPNNIQTYLIGEGKMFLSDNISFYMDTDVGYLRLIYFFGIIGLLLYILLQIVPLVLMILNSKITFFKYLSFLSIILFLILMFKGLTDLYYIFALFYFINHYFFKDKAKFT